MQVTIEQLQQISIFSGLDRAQLVQLQAHAVIKQYFREEIILHEGTTLLEMIQNAPELALQIIAVLTERLQQIHQVVHGLASERAIVRLAQFIQRSTLIEGTDATEQGLQLRSRLPYYQMARSIGITYEECVRLFKQMEAVVIYRHGGKILVLDQERLAAIANGQAM